MYHDNNLYGSGLWDFLRSAGQSIKKNVINPVVNTAPAAYVNLNNAYRSAIDPKHKYYRKLYPGEMHYGLHNFTGPGTRIDLMDVQNTRPINDIDFASKVHDLEYYQTRKIENPDSKAEAIHKADEKAIKAYSKHLDENGALPAIAGISGKWAIEQLLSSIKGRPSVFYGTGKFKESKKYMKPSKSKNNNETSVILYEPFYDSKKTPKGKKYSVYVLNKKTRKPKIIHFGDSKMEQYKDNVLGLYADSNHLDKERRKRYLKRAKGIKDKNGKYTYKDKNSANYWSVKYLW